MAGFDFNSTSLQGLTLVQRKVIEDERGSIAYQHLPQPEISPSFSYEAVKEVWQFAKGIVAITFLSLLLMQTDKILLSRLLTLESFGYYTLELIKLTALEMVE